MRALIASTLLSAACAWLPAGPAAAHDQETHAAPAQQAVAETPAALAAFPFDFGGPFALTDHTGRPVTERDFLGAPMLVFFGYASCESICPVGLKRMVDTLELLGADGARIQPVLITVDPERDSVETLAGRVAEIHPRLIGLTGTPEQLAAAARAYKVESRAVGTSWKGDKIFSHGSYIYLMGPDGSFATLLPPILDPQAMAKTIRSYL